MKPNRETRFRHLPAWAAFVDVDDLVRCPVCHSPYVHIQSVTVEQGHQTTHVTGRGTHTSPSDRHEHQKGSAVVLAFFCEDGHRWSQSWAFAKGNTRASIRLAPPSGGQFLPSSELWRN